MCLLALPYPPPPERDPPRILGKKKKKPDPETKPLLFSQQLERRKKPYEGRAEATAQLQIRPNKRSPFFLLCVRALPPKVQSQRALPPPLIGPAPPIFRAKQPSFYSEAKAEAPQKKKGVQRVQRLSFAIEG